jgi:hypothetical protein
MCKTWHSRWAPPGKKIRVMHHSALEGGLCRRESWTRAGTKSAGWHKICWCFVLHREQRMPVNRILDTTPPSPVFIGGKSEWTALRKWESSNISKCRCFVYFSTTLFCRSLQEVEIWLHRILVNHDCFDAYCVYWHAQTSNDLTFICRCTRR